MKLHKLSTTTCVKRRNGRYLPIFGLATIVVMLWLTGQQYGVMPGLDSAVADATNSSSKQKAISVQDAQLLATQLTSPSKVSLKLKGYRSWGIDEGKGKLCYHFVSPADEAIEIDVDTLSGQVYYLYRGRLASASQVTRISIDEAKSKATTFLNQQVKPNASSPFKIETEKLHNGGLLGILYRFEWSKTADQILLPWNAFISVSAETGDVVKYELFDNIKPLRNLVPLQTKEQVKRIATAKINLQEGWQWKSIQLTVAGDITQRLVWIAEAQGIEVGEYDPHIGQVGYEIITTININDSDGKIYSVLSRRVDNRKKVQICPPIPQPRDLWFQDSFPAWSEEKSHYIVFATSRRTNKSKEATDKEKSVLCTVENGKIAALLSLPFVCRYSMPAEKTDYLAIERYHSGPAFVLNLHAGIIGRVNDENRHKRLMPFWDSTGTRLVMSGSHLSSDKTDTMDDDIFVSGISERLSINSAQYHRCIAHLPGRDILPVFTSDDKWVVFAHEEKPGNEKGWAIYRAKLDKGFNDPEHFKPEKLVEGLTEPERLSPFPDGRRVLVSYTGNEFEMENPTEIVDIEAETRTLLKLPALFDPDLPKGKPLVPRESAISPDGKQIVFSALRWSGDPKDDGAILIYTCNLDGTGLKRITPPTDVRLEPYKFPQEGVTALNAWEKLQPKHNQGHGIKWGDFEARDKYIKEIERQLVEKQKR